MTVFPSLGFWGAAVEVSGEIVLAADCASFEDATAFVFLEDVGCAGISARRIGVAILTSVAHRRGVEARIPFVVAAADVPVSNKVALRVHVSLDGHPDITAHDLVSATHAPANAYRTVDVAVKPVELAGVDQKIAGAVSGARYRKQCSAKPRLSGIRRN